MPSMCAPEGHFPETAAIDISTSQKWSAADGPASSTSDRLERRGRRAQCCDTAGSEGRKPQIGVVHVYPDRGARPLRLDLYSPETNGPHPLLIWLRGGGWHAGTTNMVPFGILRQLKRGFAIASVEYTLSDEEIWPAQIHDAKAAVRWLRANAKQLNLDPARFAAVGSSAGGHLASLLGTTSGPNALEGSLGHTQTTSDVSAVISFHAPAEFASLGKTGIFDYDEFGSPVSRLLGAAARFIPNTAAEASPITHVTVTTPPFCLLHGTSDRVVDINPTRRFEYALRKANVPVTAVYPETFVHEDPRFSGTRIMSGIESFLDHLASGNGTTG